MYSRIFVIALLLCILPVSAFAEGVIGRDSHFNLIVPTILVGNDPYNEVFNYFFTIQLFFGAFAFSIKAVLRTAKWYTGL